MSYNIIQGTLGSAVADDGTFTVSYPAGTDEGTFALSAKHQLVVNQVSLTAPAGFTLTFGTSNITVTNKSGAAWPISSKYYLQAEHAGTRGVVEASSGTTVENTSVANLVNIQLGAPDALDADGVFTSVSQAAGSITLDGALTSGGVATFDVPRNIVIDSGGADTATLTFTGTDVYGNTMTEAITLNGTTAVAGKKAFKTVTACANDATISNGAFAGTGDVIGLPVAIPSTGVVLAELEDGAAASAGTVVAADVTAGGATATTGDVRGTYDPNSACDGDKYFTLVVALPDVNLGTPQA